MHLVHTEARAGLVPCEALPCNTLNLRLPLLVKLIKDASGSAAKWFDGKQTSARASARRMHADSTTPIPVVHVSI